MHMHRTSRSGVDRPSIIVTVHLLITYAVEASHITASLSIEEYAALRAPSVLASPPAAPSCSTCRQSYSVRSTLHIPPCDFIVLLPWILSTSSTRSSDGERDGGRTAAGVQAAPISLAYQDLDTDSFCNVFDDVTLLIVGSEHGSE
jgi:hypothetical protein